MNARLITLLLWGFFLALVHAQAPNAPSNLNATLTTQNQTNGTWNALFTWQDNANNEDGFGILEYNGTNFVVLGTLSANSTSVNVTSILNGQTVSLYLVSFRGDPGSPQNWLIQEIMPFPIIRAPDQFTENRIGTGVVSSFFSRFINVSNSSNVVQYAASNMPAWLSINAQTGLLSGVPTADGVFTINLSITYVDGWVLNEPFTIRIRKQAGAPLVSSPTAQWTTTVGQQRVTPLSTVFSDPEAESAMRITTNMGTVDVILYANATPVTVSNFLNYVNAGKYNNVALHRSIPGFVVQGGGFRGTGTGSQFTSVVNDPPIVNEPGFSNVRGTIAMAKVAGNPNSATGQFFFNMANNAGILDNQNGGFTVFGRVAGNGMNVVDAINQLPRSTYPLNLDGNANAVNFDDFPMNASTAPAIMDQNLLVKILSVAPVAPMSFSVTGNSQSDVAAASIINGDLRIEALKAGQTIITVTASDLDQQTSDQQVSVLINDTFATWAARSSFPNGQDGVDQNSDGDSFNNLLEYAFLGDPAISQPGNVPILGETSTVPGSRALTLQFPLRKFTSDLVYWVEANSHLGGTWTEIWNSQQGFHHSQVIHVNEQTDRMIVTIKDKENIGVSPQRFLRVRVVKN
jgi:cyclophilin family peptidyl-prolyl cis-trans isomerase